MTTALAVGFIAAAAALLAWTVYGALWTSRDDSTIADKAPPKDS